MAAIEHRLKSFLQQQLSITITNIKAVGGGSINDTYQLTTADQPFFCKINSATKFPHLFQKEAEGLQLLTDPGIFRTPKIIGLVENDHYQVLLLEWIETTMPTSSFWKLFGEKLAQLHKHTQSYFGLETDNYMGAVWQSNTVLNNWPSFLIEQRLQPLVDQCMGLQLLNTKHIQLFEKLYVKLPSVFNEEPPALLHGDLWSGNFMCSDQQEPVLIDPAVYFGHRSVDLGMTTLFGGFHPSFYEAYHYHHPLPYNHKEQWKLANLYPLLIHLQLFGKTYLPSIERTLNDFQ
jgi:protein-ribulosamine 3-kinase